MSYWIRGRAGMYLCMLSDWIFLFVRAEDAPPVPETGEADAGIGKQVVTNQNGDLVSVLQLTQPILILLTEDTTV
jgi:ATP phosphoribosyltransferase